MVLARPQGNRGQLLITDQRRQGTQHERKLVVTCPRIGFVMTSLIEEPEIQLDKFSGIFHFGKFDQLTFIKQKRSSKVRLPLSCVNIYNESIY